MKPGSVVRALAWKDMRAIGSNLQVWLPMLIVPLIIGVIMPGALTWTMLRFGGGPEGRQIIELLEQIPAGSLAERLAGFDTPVKQAAFFLANYLLAPFFLLIPLMSASTVSADSFAGEKERGTLESLLFSPISVTTLFLGKTLAAFLPAMALTLLTFLLTAVTVNAVAWPWMQSLFFPTLNWLPLLLFVIPLISLGAIFLNVFISARVTTFQAAYQLGGLVVLPIIGLLVGQLTGVLLLDFRLILWLSLVLLVLDGLLLLLLRRFLDRPQLFESQIR
jgi:ABC-type Na+ efflux pump permease subunit